MAENQENKPSEQSNNKDEQKKATQQDTKAVNPASEHKEKQFAIEELAIKKNIPAWAIAGMKQAHKWGEGKMVTEAEFDELHGKLRKGSMANR